MKYSKNNSLIILEKGINFQYKMNKENLKLGCNQSNTGGILISNLSLGRVRRLGNTGCNLAIRLPATGCGPANCKKPILNQVTHLALFRLVVHAGV